jgi:hypothetical protein
MFLFVYYFILSFLIIYIIHNFILYLKTTFTLPKVLDISPDVTTSVEQDIYDKPYDQTHTYNDSSTFASTSLKNEIDDINELTNYLQDITRPINNVNTN